MQSSSPIPAFKNNYLVVTRLTEDLHTLNRIFDEFARLGMLIQVDMESLLSTGGSIEIKIRCRNTDLFFLKHVKEKLEALKNVQEVTVQLDNLQ